MGNNFSQFKQQIDQALALVENSAAIKTQERSNTQLGELVDTQSLLARCEKVCTQHESKKPTIRIIHHLACSGGTELTEYLAALPNIFVLSEVHPFQSLTSTFPSLNITDSIHPIDSDEGEGLRTHLFLENIKYIYQHLKSKGKELVIRDNSYIDYLASDRVMNKSVVSVLEEDFDVFSVVLYRDSLDSYASLKKNNFFDNMHYTFDDYCKRINVFLSDYSSAKVVKYEELHGNPTETIKDICNYFSLSFNEHLELMTFNLNFPQFDSWIPSRDDRYNSKLETVPALKVIEESKAYFELQHKTKNRDKTLILIATMPRSGSTWLFNCVREIYTQQNEEFYSCWIEDYDPSHAASTHIVKVHNPELRLSSQADIIFSCRRDIRNVCSSLIRMGWLKDKSKDIINTARYLVNKCHPFWSNRSTREFEYNLIKNSGEDVIRKIYEVLGFPCDSEKESVIAKKLNNLSSDNGKYDPLTQMHPEHRAEIETSYSTSLNADVIIKINEEHKSWLSKYNYL